MVSSGETQNEVASDDLLPVGDPDASEPILDDVNNISQDISESGIHASQSNLEGRTAHTVTEKASQEPGAGIHILRIDQEGSISAIPKKVSESPIALESKQGTAPPIIREKVSEDGYHWRKYGQKHVKCGLKVGKGNELIRSYYKCTHSKCLVKKQLEISYDGQIIHTISFGRHDHPKPRDNLPVDGGVVEEKRDDPSLSGMEDSQKPREIEPANTPQLSVASNDDVKGALLDSNRTRFEVDIGDTPGGKRTKKGNRKGDATLLDKPTSGPRTVLQTLSEVDVINDGYRWRKYGQKLVKGNPNPRSYYRCSTYGCPAKKHIERAAHDPALVITTYEGQHDHDSPPARRVTHNPSSSDTNNRGSKAGLDEQCNGESGTRLNEIDGSCLDMAVHANPVNPNSVF